MLPRIRTIKPEFFRHEELHQLEVEEKLPIRLSFIGLLTCCDREGRFQWRPKTLKAIILPYDDCDFSRVLDALATRAFVVKYASNGEYFGYIPSWKRHQHINNRETPSILPEPTQESILQQVDACPTRAPRVPHAGCTEREREQKGTGTEREHIKTTPRAERALLFEDFPEFWEAYPKKEQRKVAQRIWSRMNPADRLAATAALTEWKRTRRWQEGYIPNPPTYLNQRRWEDQIPIEEPNGTKAAADRLTQRIDRIAAKYA